MSMKIYAILVLTLICSCGHKPATRDTGSAFHLTRLDEMHRIDVGDGEVVYQAEGRDHHMRSMSFVITETQKGGGPPLHVHPVEEAHVVLSGRVTYFIADSIFTVTAPFIISIPAHTPHTFINAGDSVLHLVGVFGQDQFGPYKPIGRNPLIK